MFTSHYNKSACVIVELLKSVYEEREYAGSMSEQLIMQKKTGWNVFSHCK